MQIHAKIAKRIEVTITIDHPEDVSALRQMAFIVCESVGPSTRSGSTAVTYRQARAYALAQWLLDRVPEAE